MTATACPECDDTENYNPEPAGRCGMCGHTNPPDERALTLTQQEWDDLATMLFYYLQHYPSGTAWRTDDRRRALAERIIEANQ